jgi:catechol 2,3-dioxygenase-like lactoylglutathione lyase family enzyme
MMSSNGAYSRPWSKTMVGYGGEKENFVFELTFNYGITSYHPAGNDFRYAKINCLNLANTIQAVHLAGFQIIQGSDSDDQTFCMAPDGYKFMLVAGEADVNCVLGVALNVSSLEKSVSYYRDVLQLIPLTTINGGLTKTKFKGSTEGDLPYVELFQLNEPISHEKSYGRLALAVDGDSLQARETDIKKRGHKIHTPYVSLDTPGKATVQVVILSDPDQYEVCLVGSKGFFDLCRPFDGCDVIDFEKRIESGSKEAI